MIANTNQPASMASAAASTTSLPTNAASVNYFDENNQVVVL